MLQQLYFASDNVGAKNSAKLSYQWAVWRSQMPKAPPVLPVLPGALCSLSAETSHSLMVSRRQAGPSAPTRQPEHAGPRRRPSLPHCDRDHGAAPPITRTLPGRRRLVSPLASVYGVQAAAGHSGGDGGCRGRGGGHCRPAGRSQGQPAMFGSPAHAAPATALARIMMLPPPPLPARVSAAGETPAASRPLRC